MADASFVSAELIVTVPGSSGIVTRGTLTFHQRTSARRMRRLQGASHPTGFQDIIGFSDIGWHSIEIQLRPPKVRVQSGGSDQYCDRHNGHDPGGQSNERGGHEQAEDRNSNTSDSDVEDGLSACFVFGRQNNRKAASYPLSSTPIAQGVSTCADSRKSIGMCQTQVIICKMDGGGGGTGIFSQSFVRESVGSPQFSSHPTIWIRLQYWSVEDS